MQPTKVRWQIFALACASSWLLYLHRYAWGIIKPTFRSEYPELSDVEIGWLDSAFLATYALGQIPGGMAGDFFGPRGVLSVLALVGSLAILGVAWTTGFWRLIVARGAFGLAQAGVYPVLAKITRIWFPTATRTGVQGMVTSMGRIGAASAGLIIATLLMGWLDLSWQATLYVLTAPGILLAVALWVIVRNRPGEHPWVNQAEIDLINDAPAAPSAEIRAGDPPIRPAPSTDAGAKLQWSGASLFSFFMMCMYIFASTFQDQFWVFWLPSFLQQGKGFPVETMGMLVPLVFIGAAIGGLIGGFLNNTLIRRTGNRRWTRTGIAFTGKAVAACLVLASIQFEDGRLILAVLVAARVFSDWSLPTQWGAVTDMGGRAAATVFGIVNTVGALGGFVAGPIFGYLKQELGWAGLFYGVSAMCAFAALTWLGIDCTKKVVSD